MIFIGIILGAVIMYGVTEFLKNHKIVKKEEKE